MPVFPKDRLMRVTAAAAMIFTAVSLCARAQSQTLNLRGTTDPLLPQNDTQTQSGFPTGTAQGGTNPAGLNADATGTAPGASPTANTATTDAPPSPDGPAPTTNYGKPKPKKPKLYRLPALRKPGFPQLPPLTTYKTYDRATTKKKTDTTTPPSQTPDPPPTAAVIQSLPNPPKPKREDKPFDPLGVDVGSLRLFPYVEVDTGYDTNPNFFATQVVGSSFVHGETGLKLQSQWSQNSFSADLRSGYWEYLQLPLANRPDLAGTANGRIDVTKTTKINLESRFGLTTQQPGQPQIAIPSAIFTTNRPLVMNLGQTVGASQQFNRLTLDLRGTFDRFVFGDATQSDGTELLLSRDTYNMYGLTGRASYELTPGVIPFLEVRADTRRYDSYYAFDGFARDSDGIAVKAGSKIELTRLLTGEVSAGYATRDYVDPRLPLLNAPTVDANLVYTATPLTTLNLTAATYLSETIVPFSSGAVSRVVTGKVTHALFRNLTLTGTASYQINNYVGAAITEQLYSVGLGLEYNLTRSVVVRGTFTHQKLGSNFPGDAFTDDLFLVGLKLQN